MDFDYLSFFQNRLARAYEEQIWAVAIVGGMNAFVGNQAKQLLQAFKYITTVIGVSITSMLALLFVWSRHIIFVHYDSQLKDLMTDTANFSMKVQNTTPLFLESLARLSGVSFYSVVILGMAFIALKRLSIENKQNIAEPGA